jgi:hypothetical protein
MTTTQASANKKRQRELIETQDELGYSLLGYTVIPSLKGIEINRADALAILTPLGYHDYLPGLPKSETSLKRAIKAWMKELAHQDMGATDDDDILLRAITRRGKSEMIALALVVESSDLQAWGLGYLVGLRVFYDKKTGILSLNRPSNGQSTVTAASDKALLDKLEPYWEYYKEVYTVSELGRMVSELINKVDAASMRKEGGTYFIPYMRRTNTGEQLCSVPELQRLKDLIELQFPGAPNGENTSSLNTFPVIDSKKTRRQMAEIAHKSFVGELTAMKKDLERFVAQLQKKSTTKKGRVKYGKVKEETVLARLADYKNVKTKIELYQATLDMRQEELLAELEALAKTANSLRETATDIMSEQAELDEDGQGATPDTDGEEDEDEDLTEGDTPEEESAQE